MSIDKLEAAKKIVYRLDELLDIEIGIVKYIEKISNYKDSIICVDGCIGLDELNLDTERFRDFLHGEVNRLNLEIEKLRKELAEL